MDMVHGGQHKPIIDKIVAPEEQKNIREQNEQMFSIQNFTEQKTINGCPFFNKEITDPQGKNITQGFA